MITPPNRVAVQPRQREQIARQHAVFVDGLLRAPSSAASWRSVPRREKRPEPCSCCRHQSSAAFVFAVASPPTSSSNHHGSSPRRRQSRSPSLRRRASPATTLRVSSPAVTPRKTLRPVRHPHALALRIARNRLKSSHHALRPFAQKSIVVGLEFPQQPHQQFQPRLRLPVSTRSEVAIARQIRREISPDSR